MRMLLGYASLILASIPAAAQTAPTPPPSPALAVIPPGSATPLTPEQEALRARSAAGDAQVVAFSKVARAKMTAARFSGEIGIAHAFRDGRPASDVSPIIILMAQDGNGNVRTADDPWRWASITKQVVAVLLMQEAARGRIELDKPVAHYLPAFRSANARRMSVRQLLRHQTGLPNPDDTPANAEGVPAFYTQGFTGSRDPLSGYCAGPVKDTPGGEWAYNNCDYMVAGALLEAVTGKDLPTLVRERLARPIDRASALMGMRHITTAPPSSEVWPGTVGGKREPAFDLASYGAAGGMSGPLSDLLSFDIYLATGNLLPPAAMADMWDGRPELGYVALGQWVFEAPLKGCAAPVKIVERRGAIGGVQARNFILPETEMALAMFTDQAEFDFGEIWQGEGFSYEMLSLAACPQEPS